MTFGSCQSKEADRRWEVLHNVGFIAYFSRTVAAFERNDLMGHFGIGSQLTLSLLIV